jgi:hypothetical protein
MATSRVQGSVRGTAEFRQQGTSVTAVVDLTGCTDGRYELSIHEGFACDHDGAIGGVWDGPRGAGLGEPGGGVACSGGQIALTYTRAGNDPSTNWTVGDHAAATDVTPHVIIVRDSNGKRVACGNFF